MKNRREWSQETSQTNGQTCEKNCRPAGCSVDCPSLLLSYVLLESSFQNHIIFHTWFVIISPQSAEIISCDTVPVYFGDRLCSGDLKWLTLRREWEMTGEAVVAVLPWGCRGWHGGWSHPKARSDQRYHLMLRRLSLGYKGVSRHLCALWVHLVMQHLPCLYSIFSGCGSAVYLRAERRSAPLHSTSMETT